VRVVSFLPSATEIVAALGRLDDIVGVSHECDFPPSVRSRDVVTSSAIDSKAAPGEIDVAVRDFVDTGRPLYDVRAERVRELAPDVMVTQVVCDVCAVSEDDVRALAARLRPRPEVVTLGATTLDGIFDDIRSVAAALGVTDRAEELIERSRARMRVVHETLKTARAPRPRVAVIEWTDPVFAAGHWVPEMIYRAGGEDVLAEPGEHSRTRTIDAIRGADPEFILIAPCGFDLERAAADGERALATDEWAWAREKQAWAVDANAFLSRPGPRVVDGIEVLATVLHPSLFRGPDPSAARRIGA
jgi:iron complex transport system substrate-binding protein